MTDASTEKELENYKTAFEFSQKRQREYIEKWQKLHSYLNSFLELDCDNGCIEDDDKLIEAVKEKFSTPKTKQASKFEINEYAIYDGNKMRRKDYTALMSSPPQYRFYTNDNKVYTIRGTEMLQIAESK